jgi:hypothetical protein
VRIPVARNSVRTATIFVRNMTADTASASPSDAQLEPSQNGSRPKLHGRAFYESLGSPRIVLAPMVEQSEFVRRYSYPSICIEVDLVALNCELKYGQLWYPSVKGNHQLGLYQY